MVTFAGISTERGAEGTPGAGTGNVLYLDPGDHGSIHM